MKYKIEKLKQAEKEILKLTKEQQKALKNDFDTIENKGLEYVKRRHLREELFEIKLAQKRLKGAKMTYIYAKDSEGFVVKKKKSELLQDEQIISKDEYNELSGENYYKKTFGHGGKREGAGRKPTNGVVLKFQIRVSEKEKEFLNYARAHNLNYDDLMEG